MGLADLVTACEPSLPNVESYPERRGPERVLHGVPPASETALTVSFVSVLLLLMNIRTFRPYIIPAAKTLGGTVLVLAAGLAGIANSIDPVFNAPPYVFPDRSTGTVAGPVQSLGDGTAHAFVTLEKGRPIAFGVRVTEAALATLPMDGVPHGGHETLLAFPADVAAAPFDHISLDWQPQGHEPDGVYTRPHFDVHFYMMTHAERDAITPMSPTFATEAAVAPGATVIPTGYVPTSDAFARMGVHWVDPSSPEFTPAGFSRTFIYGFWNGKMNFVEPMLTREFIESVKTLPGQSATFAIPQPRVYEKAGYYPTLYGVHYDAAAQAYDIVLEGLTKR